MSEEDNSQQTPTDHVFENMDEFALFLSNSGLFILDKQLTTFYDAYNAINHGCKCARKKRLATALELYLGFKELSLGSKSTIRTTLRSETSPGNFTLKHDGEAFLVY
jgi:hypothetical protein